MKIEKSAAALVGYVRGVFSERCRGVAFPLDLVRVHCRAVAEVGRREYQRARAAGFIHDAFSGYLVTDPDDDELRALEVAPFVSRRREHMQVLDRIAVTGGVSGLVAGVVLRSDDEGDLVRVTGWHLDAPGYIAAGGMRRHHGEFDCEGFAAPMIRGRE